MKSKTITGFCSLFGGGIGIQWFYLGKPFYGISMILLCWTFIPAIIGIIMGCAVLAMDDEEWEKAQISFCK